MALLHIEPMAWEAETYQTVHNGGLLKFSIYAASSLCLSESETLHSVPQSAADWDKLGLVKLYLHLV